MFKRFKVFFRRIKKYVAEYGGVNEILLSPFFLISLFITIISYSAWWDVRHNLPKWVDLCLSLLPNLLGFSLGTYALLFSIIGGKLKKALISVKDGSGVPYLNSINATFYHFIFVQVAAIVNAIAFKSSIFYDIKPILNNFFQNFELIFFLFKNLYSFLGALLLVYSILLVVASAQIIYRLAGIKEPD